mmetsp:Transcript_47626/g.108040  ORF Transcript_47626/g.108040 Transcript_47626/m.108040 type:complete len:249 (-) Transcript_47626:52-798(-)
MASSSSKSSGATASLGSACPPLIAMHATAWSRAVWTSSSLMRAPTNAPCKGPRSTRPGAPPFAPPPKCAVRLSRCVLPTAKKCCGRGSPAAASRAGNSSAPSMDGSPSYCPSLLGPPSLNASRSCSTARRAPRLHALKRAGAQGLGHGSSGAWPAPGWAAAAASQRPGATRAPPQRRGRAALPPPRAPAARSRRTQASSSILWPSGATQALARAMALTSAKLACPTARRRCASNPRAGGADTWWPWWP